MSHRVTLIRRRVIEEKIVSDVACCKPEDAVSATQHLVEGNRLEWKYSRTLETSEPTVEVKENPSR